MPVVSRGNRRTAESRIWPVCNKHHEHLPCDIQRMAEHPKNFYGSVIKKLRHRGKRRKKCSADEKRGKIQISHDITERPAGAENRSEIGHLEADTVVGQQGKACLVTLVDRKIRYLMCGKADKKNAQAVNRTIIDLLPGATALSVTPDRGKEFAPIRRYRQNT